MTHNHFTYKELLSFGWEKTKEHFPFLLSLLVGAFLVAVLTGGIPLVGDIMAGLVTIAMISVLFVIVSGHKPHYKDLTVPFSTYKVTLHYFLAMILYLLAVLAGLVLLILPGIYVAIRLQFFSYLAVEHENMGPVDILKKSWALTRGKFWKLFGWSILLFLINFAGLLLFGLGLIFTIPITAITYTQLYKKLVGHAPEVEHHEVRHAAETLA